MFVAGALGAVQSRANGTLAEVSGEALYAALWSFGSGWALLTLGLLLPSARRGLAAVYHAWRGRRIRWWQCLGGLIGGAFVAVQTYAVPRTGVALFLLAIVAGQTVGGLLVDRVGLGPGARRPVTRARAGWAALTVLGAALAMGDGVGALGVSVLAPVAAAAGVGAALAAQSAVNGLVIRASGNVLATTWINFTWGLVLLAGLTLGRTPAAPVAALWEAPWWAYSGGLCGILVVAAVALAVQRLGVLVVMLLMISGQLLGALALDLAVPATRHLVGVRLVTGVAVTILAAVASAGVSAPGRGRPRARRRAPRRRGSR